MITKTDTKRFRVVGAGELIISGNANWSCGNAQGFHLGVTWGICGEAGGVIDLKDAFKLAVFIFVNLIPEILSYYRKKRKTP